MAEIKRPGRDITVVANNIMVMKSLNVAERLAKEGIEMRVVSLPSWEIFDRQPVEYRNQVLPPKISARLAVEAGIRLGWEHYVGLSGKIIGMDTFGASAPGTVLYEKFGFTPANIVAAAKEMLAGR